MLQHVRERRRTKDLRGSPRESCRITTERVYVSRLECRALSAHTVRIAQKYARND